MLNLPLSILITLPFCVSFNQIRLLESIMNALEHFKYLYQILLKVFFNKENSVFKNKEKLIGNFKKQKEKK